MGSYLWEAFLNNLAPELLLLILAGAAVGTIIGAIPGLSAVSAVALVLPFTFAMNPIHSLLLLASVYTSAEYGGSIPAILIGTPGTSGAVATLLDGHPLTLQGKAREALYTSLFAGTVAGLLGALAALFFTPWLASLVLLFGPAEIFWVAVSGLALVASLTARANVIKGLIGVALGFALTIVGQDPITGNLRYTFGLHQLVGGVGLVPALLGLFAVASVFELVERRGEAIAPLAGERGSALFVLRKLVEHRLCLMVSSLIGILIGAIPGAGASMSAFVSYGVAKRLSKRPEAFGKGSYEGLIAPEAANNSMVGGSFIPLLTLGIPGSSSAAVIYGALSVHGIIPGPRLFTERAELAYTFLVGLAFTTLAMLVFGMATIRWSSLVVRVPSTMMLPAVLATSAIGAYSLNNNLFDVYVLMAVGIVGFLLLRAGVPLAAMALGLVLGSLTEQNFQRMAIVAQVQAGSIWAYTLSRPLAVGLMLFAVAVVVAGLVQLWREREPAKAAEAAPPEGRDRGPSLRTTHTLMVLVVAAVSVWALAQAQHFSPQGALFPRLVFGSLLALSGLQLAQTWLGGQRDARRYPFEGFPWRLWFAVVLAFVGLGLAIPRLGFYAAVLVFSALVCYLLIPMGPALQRLRTATGFAVIFTLVLYACFKGVLAVPTPRGWFL